MTLSLHMYYDYLLVRPTPKRVQPLCHIREKLTVATQAECTQHAMVSPPSHCETGQWLLLSGMWREKIRKDLLHFINR